MQKNERQTHTRRRNLREIKNGFDRWLFYLMTLSVIFLVGYMVNVWGNLAKAQDDAETIEEAIERLIAEHNTAPLSHAGEGEAIAVHRENSIVDHPAGSVLMDKLTASEIDFYSDFASLTGWAITGAASNAGWPGVTLEVDSGGTEESRIRASVVVPGNPFKSDKDFLFETSLYFDTVANTFQSCWGLGAQSLSSLGTAGFVYTAGALKGYIRGAAGTVYTGTILSAVSGLHKYRIVYNAFEKKAYFYIDGGLLETLEMPSGVIYGTNQVTFYFKANGEESGVMKIFNAGFGASL